MKQIILLLAIVASIFTTANAQENWQNSQSMFSTGDLYDGLTRPLTFNRMIAPYALEVTFSKTVCAHKGE